MMNTTGKNRINASAVSALFASGEMAIILIALGKFALHLATANRYGYFIDELYTIAMGKHVAGGFVDVPPLVPIITGAWTGLFGASLFSIRFLAAVFGALTVYAAGRIGRELGLKPAGQAFVALTALVSPILLAMNSFMAYDGPDQFLSAAFFFAAVKLLKGKDPRLWIAVGAAGGLALMAKYTMLFLALAFLIGILISDRRKDLATPWPWLGALCAVLIALPWGIWQAFHHWPLIDYWQNYARTRVYRAGPGEFAVTQLISYNPLAAPLWLGGLAWLLMAITAKPFRALGFTALAAYAIFFLTSAPAYMTASLYPFLYSAGYMAIQGWSAKGKRAWAAPSAAVLIALTGAAMMPTLIPLLSPEKTVDYNRRFTGLWSKAKVNNGIWNKLPQYMADRLGWPELVEAVAKAYSGLSDIEKSDCLILTQNYGQAGAIDLLGGKYGLPKAASGHNSYYLWGYGGKSGDTTIAVGLVEPLLRALFTEVEFSCVSANVPLAMVYNREVPIYVCRNPIQPLDAIWRDDIMNYY
jgi:hypothetical protein